VSAILFVRFCSTRSAYDGIRESMSESRVKSYNEGVKAKAASTRRRTTAPPGTLAWPSEQETCYKHCNPTHCLLRISRATEKDAHCVLARRCARFHRVEEKKKLFSARFFPKKEKKKRRRKQFSSFHSHPNTILIRTMQASGSGEARFGGTPRTPRRTLLLYPAFNRLSS
jgi:hypothetical protein